MLKLGPVDGYFMSTYTVTIDSYLWVFSLFDRNNVSIIYINSKDTSIMQKYIFYLVCRRRVHVLTYEEMTHQRIMSISVLLRW